MALKTALFAQRVPAKVWTCAYCCVKVSTKQDQSCICIARGATLKLEVYEISAVGVSRLMQYQRD